jgi:hypothetical protein
VVAPADFAAFSILDYGQHLLHNTKALLIDKIPPNAHP